MLNCLKFSSFKISGWNAVIPDDCNTWVLNTSTEYTKLNVELYTKICKYNGFTDWKRNGLAIKVGM